MNDNPEVPGQHSSGAANIKTTAKFQDFKLHVEFKCDPDSNSGVYLRGRYEVQIETDSPNDPPNRRIGSVDRATKPPGLRSVVQSHA